MNITIRFPPSPEVEGAGQVVTGVVVFTRDTAEYQYRFEWRTADGRTLSRMVDKSWIVVDACEGCGGNGCKACFGTGVRAPKRPR